MTASATPENYTTLTDVTILPTPSRRYLDGLLGDVIGAMDQRTTAGPVDSISAQKDRRHDRTHDPRNAKNSP